MDYPLLILFGIAPSIIWLLLYLQEDRHPESKKMILKIFLWGALISVPTILLELGFREFLTIGVFDWRMPFSPFILLIINTFIGVALAEEFLKFLVVREKVLKNSEFDEPIDAVIYMIVSALGFAAAENMLILFASAFPFDLGEAFVVSTSRFLGATFLHALVSGILGFFLAYSLRQRKNRGKNLLAGLFIASLLHGLYNFSIIMAEGVFYYLIPLAILMGSALFLVFAFKRLRKLKSVSL